MPKKQTIKPVQRNELAFVGVDVVKSIRLQITVNGKLEYLDLDEMQVEEIQSAFEEAEQGW